MPYAHDDSKIIKKTDSNIHDLYIHFTAAKKKEKYNKILLLIHGGGWMKGNKKELNDLCEMYIEMEFIVASIEYTLLDEDIYLKNIIFIKY